MVSRVYRLDAGERNFQIRITSDVNGYRARLMEILSDELVVPAGLHVPPRLQIDPSAFYQHRKRYRHELMKLVNAELLGWRVKKLDKAEASQDNDAYILANLDGWPDGHSTAVEDDLDDWKF